MKNALDSPRPYLINQAGGLVQVKSFMLASKKVQIAPISDSPVTGVFHLVYRCPDHENFDIKCAVSSDGEKWSVMEPLPESSDYEVCYP